MKFEEIKGNLISLASEGKFDIIAHGCNCFCTMGAGIAPQMAKAFGADKFPKEHSNYRGDINKLGTIDYIEFTGVCSENPDKQMYNHIKQEWVPIKNNFLKSLTIVNAYTQYHYGANHADGKNKPLDYEALILCMRKINHRFKGKHIGLPLIGAGLAGGIWSVKELPNNQQLTALPFGVYKDIKTIIQDELKDCDVTIVHYDNA